MNTCDDAAVKRSLLLGARIRFSPSGASVRNQAIERIIEQNLASAETANGLTEQQLQNLVTLDGRFSMLRASDVKQGLVSLMRSKRVLVIADGKEHRYSLSDTAKVEVTRVISDSEEQIKSVIAVLFGSAPRRDGAYRRAFLRLLCIVFSKLSEVYVQAITMKYPSKDLTENGTCQRF